MAMTERFSASDSRRIDEAIIASAFELIAVDGSDAMSMRALARSVGLHPGSLYYYFPSKQDLLGELLSALLQARLDQWLAVRPVNDDPLARLRAFIAFHVKRHRQCYREERLLDVEIRKLQGEALEYAQSINDQYVGELSKILSTGCARQVFSVSDIALVTRSLIAMLRDSLPGDVDGNVRLFTQLAMRMLGVTSRTEHRRLGAALQSTQAEEPISPHADVRR